jgi:iron complex outermembrane recepter protein
MKSIFEHFPRQPINGNQSNKHVLLQGNTDMKLNLTIVMAVLLALLLGALIANGQTKQILTWQDSLDAILKLPAGQLEKQQDEIVNIRTGIEFWLRLHPDTTIELEEAPDLPMGSKQILKEAQNLRKAVDAILIEDRVQTFKLGATEITVTADQSILSPVTDSIDRNEIFDRNATTVIEAAQYIPGVTADYKAGRNQLGTMIRGFDTRQVGVYLDGIPLYVPYDGYTDLSRLLTSDISRIEVLKGYSSPLLGPNGLGGSINLVTRQPEKTIEGDGLFGAGSGRKIESAIHLGTRLDKFFIRGGMDWLQTDNFPLSANFTPNTVQPSFQRMNADKRDVRYNGRFGWMPKNEDQYVFTYNKQNATNDVPAYAGADAANNNVRYWEFPYWNRDSYYFNSNTGLGKSSSIKFRAFYDKYPYAQSVFSDATHKTITSLTPYDDYSGGFSSEYTTLRFPRNALSASFLFKDDTHKEHSITYSSNKVKLNTPWRLDRDRYGSLGAQDVLNLFHGVRATVGVSIDYLRGIEAQDIDSTNKIIRFACTTVTDAGTTTDPCKLADKWAYNPLASISYSVAKAGTVFFSFAQKSHFPTLKDRYSYKNGQAIPNPTLEPEHARNYNLGFTHAFPANNTTIQVEVFRSDVYDAIENAIVSAPSTTLCKNYDSKGLKCQQSVNVGNEIHKGAEFTVRSNPLRRFDLVANYTYLQRSISGPSNMPAVFPTGTPKHKAIATGNWRMPRGVLMLATFRYESGAYNLDNKNIIFPASRFATVDWGMTIPMGNIASLQCGIKNLLDRDYYYQEGYPEAGRNFYTNLRFRF